jgi:hypothetical protein
MGIGLQTHHVQAPATVESRGASAPARTSTFVGMMGSMFQTAASTFKSLTGMGGGGSGGGAPGGVAKEVEHGLEKGAELGAANLVPGFGEAKDLETAAKLGGDVMRGLTGSSPESDAASVTKAWSEHTPEPQSQAPSYHSTADAGETTMRNLGSSGGTRNILDQVGQAVSGFAGKVDSAQSIMASASNIVHGDGNTPTSMGDVNIQGDSKTAGAKIENNQAAEMQQQMQTQAKLTNMTNIFQMVTNSLQSIQKAVQDAWSNSKLS